MRSLLIAQCITGFPTMSEFEVETVLSTLSACEVALQVSLGPGSLDLADTDRVARRCCGPPTAPPRMP